MMKNIFIITVSLMLFIATTPSFAGDSKNSTIKCEMKFNIKGWSVFYKTAEGRGRITCSNGQHANVKINLTGGGLSFGKMEILDGTGTFSELLDIAEVFGSYVAAEAHAGAVKSAQASVYTKGDISLALTGTGRGINIGIDFGRLKISK
jgi:hypothetical protein